MLKCRIRCPAVLALYVLSLCPTSLSPSEWCASQSRSRRSISKRVRLVAVSSRLNAVVAFCGRPVIPDAHTTDGPTPNRSNSFAICSVMDPADEKTVIRQYKGPDTFRQFVAWKKSLLGFPFLVKSFFCGTVVSARRVDSKGECHVC